MRKKNRLVSVEAALAAWPTLGGFPGIAALEALAGRIAHDGLAEVRLLGTSREGRPIHHIVAGKGRVRALIVGGPHCSEPIGNATVAGLATLLGRGERALLDADVEWHLVPAIDPDGALLNEEWSQQAFDLATFMRGFHLQAPADQVDTSFPIAHELCRIDAPSREAKLLRSLLDRINPDFFYPLHNAWSGGGFFFSSHDIGAKGRGAVRALLTELELPLQDRPIWREICAPYAEGFVEIFSMRKYYDHLAAIGASGAGIPDYGAASWDHLAERKPNALTFVAEIGYARHPADESPAASGRGFREARLALDARCKALARKIATIRADLEPLLAKESAFYRALAGGMIVPAPDAIEEGGPPLSRYPTADILADPRGDQEMSMGELFTAAIVDGGFQYLPTAYQFVRLLKASPPHPRITAAIETLEAAFAAELAYIDDLVDISAFTPFDPDRLAKLQLGAGLHALNSVIEGTQSS